jgi:hypothetical protein
MVRSFHRLESLHLPPQTGDLVLDAASLGFGDVALFAVSSIQGRQIARDAGVHLLHALGDLSQCEVLEIPAQSRFNRMQARNSATISSPRQASAQAVQH